MDQKSLHSLSTVSVQVCSLNSSEFGACERQFLLAVAFDVANEGTVLILSPGNVKAEVFLLGLQRWLGVEIIVRSVDIV